MGEGWHSELVAIPLAMGTAGVSLYVSVLGRSRRTLNQSLRSIFLMNQIPGYELIVGWEA
jgi:hypothetical protein